MTKTAVFLIGIEGSGHYLCADLIKKSHGYKIINDDAKIYKNLLNYRSYHFEDFKKRNYFFFNYLSSNKQTSKFLENKNNDLKNLENTNFNESFIFHTSIPYGLIRSNIYRQINIPNYPKIINFFYKRKFKIKIFHLNRGFNDCILSIIRRNHEKNIIYSCWNVYFSKLIIDDMLNKLKNYKITKIYFEKLVTDKNFLHLKKLIPKNYNKKDFKNLTSLIKVNQKRKRDKELEKFINQFSMDVIN